MSLAELRSDLAQACQGVGGLHGYDYPPGDPVVPCAIVEPEEVDFESRKASGFRTGPNQGEWSVSVFVLVSPADAEDSTRKVDAFFDESSNDLRAALEAIDTYGIKVARADRWGEYPLAGNVFAGVRFVVKAYR